MESSGDKVDLTRVASMAQARHLLSQLVEVRDRSQDASNRIQQLHLLRLHLLLDMGEIVHQLKQHCQANGLYGQYLRLLKEANFSYSSSDRKLKAWQLFDQYRDAPWLVQFGASALERLATIYFHRRLRDKGKLLLCQALSQAQAGSAIGIAWVKRSEQAIGIKPGWEELADTENVTESEPELPEPESTEPTDKTGPEPKPQQRSQRRRASQSRPPDRLYLLVEQVRNQVGEERLIQHLELLLN